MRTDTLWRWGTIGTLLSLCVAGLACERADPEPHAGTGRAVSTPLDAPLPPVSTVGAMPWSVSTLVSPVTRRPAVSLRTSSRDLIGGPWSGFRPSLVVRCDGRDLEVFVVTGLSAEPEHGEDGGYGITVRIGDAPARQLRAKSEFEDRSLLLEPAGEVLSEMRENDALEVRFTSSRVGVARMRFDLRGLRDVVSELDQSCTS